MHSKKRTTHTHWQSTPSAHGRHRHELVQTMCKKEGKPVAWIDHKVILYSYSMLSTAIRAHIGFDDQYLYEHEYNVQTKIDACMHGWRIIRVEFPANYLKIVIHAYGVWLDAALATQITVHTNCIYTTYSEQKTVPRPLFHLMSRQFYNNHNWSLDVLLSCTSYAFSVQPCAFSSCSRQSELITLRELEWYEAKLVCVCVCVQWTLFTLHLAHALCAIL